MGKPDGHGGSSGRWLQDQPSLAQEGRFANKWAKSADDIRANPKIRFRQIKG
jgi:hypothetical protein